MLVVGDQKVSRVPYYLIALEILFPILFLCYVIWDISVHGILGNSSDALLFKLCVILYVILIILSTIYSLFKIAKCRKKTPTRFWLLLVIPFLLWIVTYTIIYPHFLLK